MRCEEFEQRLAELSAGRLTSPEERVCLEHAGCCSKCARLLATVRGDRQVEPPDELVGKVLERTSGGTCREARELLCDYVDGVLPPGESQLLQGHLQICTQCRALVDSLAVSHTLLPELAVAGPGPGFAEAVFERTHRLPRRSERPVDAVIAFARSLFLRPRFALEAAYIGALLLFGLYGLVPGEALQPKLFSAGPAPAELHQTATRYATAVLTGVSSRSRRLEDLAFDWTTAAGRTLSIYSAKTAADLEEHYDGVRAWLIETWQKARLHMESDRTEPTDDRPAC